MEIFFGPDIGAFGVWSIRLQASLCPKVKYNPDQYDFDVSRRGTRPKTPWSAALSWHAMPGLDLSLSLLTAMSWVWFIIF